MQSVSTVKSANEHRLATQPQLFTVGFDDIATAAPIFQQSLMQARNRGDITAEAIELYNLGICELKRDSPTQALSYLFAALAILRRIGLVDVELYAYIHIGLAYKSLGFLTLSIQYLMHALDYARRHNNRMETPVLVYLTTVLADVESCAERIDYRTELSELCKSIRIPIVKKLALCALANAYLKHGNDEEAFACYQEMLNIEANN